MEIEIKKSQTYHIVIQRKKMKRMILRYRDGNYVLSAPNDLPMNKIIAWLDELDEGQLIKLQANNKIKETRDFVYLFGKKHRICHRPVACDRVVVRDGCVFVYANDFKTAMEKFKKQTLYQYIYERISLYVQAGLIDFMPSIQIQTMKSRYGVCFYTQRRVKFSTHLVHEPRFVIDSIIIHELGHFHYPDHSKLFYEWVDTYDKCYALHEAFLKKGGAGDDPVNK